MSSSDESEDGAITIYSGRAETLIDPILDQFTEETGIPLEVRYGESAELLATIVEEGDNSPADVFFSQDAGALGALAKEDVLDQIPQADLDDLQADDAVPQVVRDPTPPTGMPAAPRSPTRRVGPLVLVAGLAGTFFGFQLLPFLLFGAWIALIVWGLYRWLRLPALGTGSGGTAGVVVARQLGAACHLVPPRDGVGEPRVV